MTLEAKAQFNQPGLLLDTMSESVKHAPDTGADRVEHEITTRCIISYLAMHDMIFVRTFKESSWFGACVP